MTAADVPTTSGMPNNGYEGMRFFGYPVFEPLVGWDLSRTDALATLKPALAESWEQDAADPRKWRFRLRQGVQFHDIERFRLAADLQPPALAHRVMENAPVRAQHRAASRMHNRAGARAFGPQLPDQPDGDPVWSYEPKWDGFRALIFRDGDEVTIGLIPETLERTTLGTAAVGTPVNVEVDVLAKYVERLVAHPAAQEASA